VAAGAVMLDLAGARPAEAATTADTVFRNGKLYPMTSPTSVDAIAVSGGKIVAIGSADVSGLVGPATKIVDLQGRTAFPGFIDPHHHTVLSALIRAYLPSIGYEQFKTRADALAQIKAIAAKTPAGKWVLASNYDNILQNGNLTMADLDAISTQHPIFVWYVNGNNGVANSTAFTVVKIPANATDLPGGGNVERGPDGKLNGMINGTPAVAKFIEVAMPPITPAMVSEQLPIYAKAIAAAGNTTLHEPGTIMPTWVPLLAKLSNTTAVRMSASFNANEAAASKSFVNLGPSTKARHLPNSRFSLYGMKIWVDGSPQLETASVTIPYLHSDNKGKLNYTVDQITKFCEAAKAAGWPMLIHCHGDEGIEVAIDAMEKVYGANSPMGLNVLQHADIIREDQLVRIQKLGIGVTFLPNFFAYYGQAYREDIFGPQRTDFIQPMATCVKMGIPFSMHTDSPATPPGPLPIVQAAVTRRCVVDGSIIGGDQAIGVHDALMAITANAARHIGLEDTIGTLEVGKEADLTILESDPHTVASDKIAGIKVSETWVGGQQEYS
jgi:hypothetical protein